MIKEKKVRIEYKNRIAIIWMEDEETNNVLSAAFMSELAQAVYTVRDNPQIEGVILTSSGLAFCVGASIEEMCSLDRHEADIFGRIGRKLNLEIEMMGKPTVAAIGGLCLGGGNELALACTWRIASTRARFGQPEVTLGIMPGAGACYRLPRTIGIGRAKEMIYGGDMVNARYAAAIGLVDKVTKPQELMTEAESFLLHVIENQKNSCGGYDDKFREI